MAELTTRIVQAVAIPRSDLATAKDRPELDHVAVYLHFGESEGAAKPIVYIGQRCLVATRHQEWRLDLPIIRRNPSPAMKERI